MKIKYSFVLIAVLALFLGVTGVLAASVTPIAYDNMEHKDAAHICVTELGFDWGMKIEAWGGPGGDRDMSGSYSGAYDSKGMLHEDFENVITLSNAKRLSFNWASDPYAIGAVVVQGGPRDNIFFYNPAINSDTNLYPDGILTDKSKKEAISHINFCWNKTADDDDDDDDPEPICYQDETAWAEGLPYVEQGNWAMYVPYDSEALFVALVAGQNMDAGTVTFSAPVEGLVTITVNLKNGFVFYYDLADEEEDDNLKVQDYEVAPEGNPAIGLFDWKTFIPGGSTTGSIVVPANNYYGVHVDLAYEIPCPSE